MSILEFSKKNSWKQFKKSPIFSWMTGHQKAAPIFAMLQLNPVQRARAYGMLEAGRRIQDMAPFFGVHPKSIGRMRTRFAHGESFEDRPRSGHPWVTTWHQDHYVTLSHPQDQCRPTSAIAAVTDCTHSRPVCEETIRRPFRESRLNARPPFK